MFCLFCWKLDSLMLFKVKDQIWKGERRKNCFSQVRAALGSSYSGLEEGLFTSLWIRRIKKPANSGNCWFVFLLLFHIGDNNNKAQARPMWWVSTTSSLWSRRVWFQKKWLTRWLLLFVEIGRRRNILRKIMRRKHFSGAFHLHCWTFPDSQVLWRCLTMFFHIISYYFQK